jgi:hypothetical protein
VRTREWGEHRTEVTEATEGNWGLVDERAWVDPAASGRGTREWGEHRTEVAEVTEGDLGVVDEKKLGCAPAAGVRRTRERGKHRTEATEWEIDFGGHGAGTVYSPVSVRSLVFSIFHPPCSPHDVFSFACSRTEAAGIDPSSFIHQPQIPLRGLRDLRAMLSLFACSRTQAAGVHVAPSPVTT